MKSLKNITMLTVSVIASALLVGCGSDSSSAVDSTILNSGYLIDAAVEGAYYETSSGIDGTTDTQGQFKYRNGDSVKFSLGKITLGECEPATDGLVTPKHLIVGDTATPTVAQTEKIALMLQTLQSLDIDNNASNGITISQTVIDSLDSIGEEILFEDMNESELIVLDNEYELGLDEDYDGYLDVNSSEADAHFEESISEWEMHGAMMSYDTSDMYENMQNNELDISTLPVTLNLSSEVKETIEYMGDEERLAYDLYTALYVKYDDVQQFTNIAQRSESKHIEAVQALMERYQITETEITSGVYAVPEIQTLYNELITLGENSKEDALKVGCIVEVTDIDDLNRDIAIAQDENATDVVATFEMLLNGSYNHYWAFDKAMKNAGFANGCFVDGDALLTDKTTLYPSAR